MDSATLGTEVPVVALEIGRRDGGDFMEMMDIEMLVERGKGNPGTGGFSSTGGDWAGVLGPEGGGGRGGRGARGRHLGGGGKERMGKGLIIPELKGGPESKGSLGTAGGNGVARTGAQGANTAGTTVRSHRTEGEANSETAGQKGLEGHLSRGLHHNRAGAVGREGAVRGFDPGLRDTKETNGGGGGEEGGFLEGSEEISFLKDRVDTVEHEGAGVSTGEGLAPGAKIREGEGEVRWEVGQRVRLGEKNPETPSLSASNALNLEGEGGESLAEGGGQLGAKWEGRDMLPGGPGGRSEVEGARRVPSEWGRGGRERGDGLRQTVFDLSGRERRGGTNNSRRQPGNGSGVGAGALGRGEGGKILLVQERGWGGGGGVGGGGSGGRWSDSLGRGIAEEEGIKEGKGGGGLGVGLGRGGGCEQGLGRTQSAEFQAGAPWDSTEISEYASASSMAWSAMATSSRGWGKSLEIVMSRTSAREMRLETRAKRRVCRAVPRTLRAPGNALMMSQH
ncbi:hypothetical protein BSKO_12691 [Bryopsis sp. KO-2023]|nr:hypothetical protein BSKO_04062 [Bryopsis sp. KO-2023]GMH38044.1 hypothetical protein BSKO_05928 [Bryopsis sp. KO-2023]GMH44739.1 hypothetical protein BSKO_12691 [Bryopsis sp. KO-2023]